MRRRQLVEIEDFAWCPRAVRDGGTDWLGFMANTTKVFAAVAPKIRAAMDAMGTTNVLDLCSGGGGPWLTLQRELAQTGPANIEVSDLYPNIDAFSDLRVRSKGRLGFHERPIDATDVPAELDGVRTMFNSFHHFPPESARSILADAVAKRRALAVFEAVNHRAVGFLAIPLQLPAILLLTPFVRPFRWSRLVFTYALPLIPGLVLFDGTVSLIPVARSGERDIQTDLSVKWRLSTCRPSKSCVPRGLRLYASWRLWIASQTLTDGLHSDQTAPVLQRCRLVTVTGLQKQW